MGKKKAKTKYAVMKKWHGGEKRMFTSYSYAKARQFYHQHPRAFGIQKYKHGVSAGLIQPDMPSRIKIDGHTYRRPYVGTHTKRDAQQLARSFRKNKLFKGARVRKFKRGYQVYVRHK